ncbi:TonB-dependent receptor [Parvibaculum sp.]|uniref:TonB-dependent receptor domain-containing protein n=1 Tax=Parvibaculum sp. TaxID=2024848 RepID=UPI000C8F91A5|nr:TonB-dependent receptor [Parvibaculum sp.]MAB13527.1 TonB-dependent receptor [Parvibaculum sp.]
MSGSSPAEFLKKLATSTALCSVAAMGLAAPAMAEDAITAPITVTATGSGITAYEYPGMVTVIDKDEIDLKQASTPDDILRDVPGVMFTGGPRRTGEVPSLRGFSGPDVVILIDGVRQNFSSGHDGRFFIDPSVVNSAEVLRGPSSSLYGSGGMGGVIEFRTIDPLKALAAGETQTSFGLGGQTANREYHATATAMSRPLDGLGIVGSLTKRESGSIELGSGSELESDDDILSGFLKGSYDAGGGHKFTASFLRFDNDAIEPNNGQANGNDYADKNLVSDTYRLGYDFNPASAWVDLKSIAYYQSFKADELRLDNNGVGPAGELLKRDVDTYGFRVDNRSRFSLTEDIFTTLTIGAEGYHDEQEGAAGGGVRGGVPDAEDSFIGGFAQAEINWARPFGFLPGDLYVVPGLRYDRFESESSQAGVDNQDSAWSPRIGGSYMPVEWLNLFGSYSEAFRAPTMDELYSTGVHFTFAPGDLGPGTAGHTNRFTPNPNLKAQKTDTFEFGAGVTFDDVLEENDRLEIKASRYYTDGENFIDLQVNQPAPYAACSPFVPGACDGTTTSVNIADAELDGVEAEAHYENDRIRVKVGFSNVDGKNKATGEKLGVLTPAMGTLDAAIKLPETHSIIGWHVIAADEFDKVNSVADERDGYVVHGVYFAWTASEGPLSGLRLDLGIDNIFDKAYARAYASSYETGRNFKGGIRYTVNW